MRELVIADVAKKLGISEKVIKKAYDAKLQFIKGSLYRKAPAPIGLCHFVRFKDCPIEPNTPDINIARKFHKF